MSRRPLTDRSVARYIEGTDIGVHHATSEGQFVEVLGVSMRGLPGYLPDPVVQKGDVLVLETDQGLWEAEIIVCSYLRDPIDMFKATASWRRPGVQGG